MKISVSHITPESYVDGPGKRVVLFVQGCPIHCPGCQNTAIWSPSSGLAINTEDIARLLKATAATNGHGNVTISGGEPFSQAEAVSELVSHLREHGIKNIILYTGYTWEYLFDPYRRDADIIRELLSKLDILVDGPFIQKKDDDLVQWRGSRNQRPILVRESLQSWISEGKVVVADWDTPTVTLTPEGNLLFPAGMSSWFGDVAETRRCGEIER